MAKNHFWVDSRDSDVADVVCLVETRLRAKREGERNEPVFLTEEDRKAERAVHVTSVVGVEFFIRRIDGQVQYFVTSAHAILKLADAIREYHKQEVVECLYD